MGGSDNPAEIDTTGELQRIPTENFVRATRLWHCCSGYE